MKIGIDCRTILNPEKGAGAGVSHYVYQLVRHLLQIDKENTYFLFFDRSVQTKKLKKFKQKNVFVRFFPFYQYRQLLPERYINHLVNATLAKENLDVLHIPSSFPYYQYKGLTVTTVHDLVFYKFPELVETEELQELKVNFPHILKKSKKIIAVSKSTAKDLRELFLLSPQKIEVIYHGIDKRFFTKTSLKDISKIKQKYKIKKKYLFFIGTLEARKNILRIIESYERFREKIGAEPGKKDISFDYQLVLSGAPGEKFEKIKKKISQSKYKKDIILTGYVPAEDLDSLFGGADLFIFPTLYEGFGLPILEALAKGVPVITSNVSSLPEITNRAAILVDPYNVAEITRGIYNVLFDRSLKKKLINQGKKVVEKFSWEKCARQTLAVYKKVQKNN
jgi:glycosyltransferase involved in cell wall biosynthesis